MKIFNLPDLGEGLAEAEVREWYVKEGDIVKVDQPLVSMETAKAIVDVPSPYAGKIVKLHGNANDIIKTGAPFITFAVEGGSAEVTDVKSDGDKGSVVGQLESSDSKWDDGDVIIGGQAVTASQIKAMPAARVLAKQLGVDLSHVTGTGPNGLITTNDVKNKLGSTTKVVSTKMELPAGSVALHGVRRVMAQAMMQSHQEIVPVTIIEDADITAIPKGADITVKLLKAIAAGVKAEPALNAWFDGKTLSRKLFTEVNIGMAVDSAEGLFVPVIKNVTEQTEESLRSTINHFKETIANRTIPASEMQGGTITLSNFGTIAGQYATPIIVPPMVAILGCGRSRETVIVKDGQITAGKVMPLSLTFDHRAVTGGEATRFLHAVIQALQH